MDFGPDTYALLFLLIGLSGFIDSIAGGGGLISVPTYLAMGVPPELILGTNKTVSTTGATLAVYRYVRAKLIHWRLIWLAALGSVTGSALGAQLSSVLSKQYMVYLVLFVTPLVLYLNHFHLKSARHTTPSVHMANLIKGGIIGFVIGGYDGFFGPGTGSFFIIALVGFLGMNFKQASANARVLNYCSNFSAFIAFLIAGKIAWSVTAVAITASLSGNYIGSHLVMTRADRIVKPVFNLVLVALLAKCIADILA